MARKQSISPKARNHKRSAGHEATVHRLARALVGATAEPSAEAVARYASLPLLFEAPPGARTVRGAVVLDSWTATGGVALRDATAGHIRRLRLGSDDIHIDLVAEKCEEGWQFTARIHAGGRVAHDFVLSADARRLAPEAGGYFHWTSRRVPRRLELWSFQTRMILDQVAWA